MAGQSTTRYLGLSYLLHHFDKLKRKEQANKYYRYAVRCFRRKEYHEVIAHFTTAITIAPEYALCYLWRGISYRRLEQYEAAQTPGHNLFWLDDAYQRVYSIVKEMP